MLTGTQPAALPAGLSLHALHEAPDATQLAWLSPRERARGDRFHFEHHRRRFLAAHCALRATLSACTGIPPEALQMTESAFGKPLLATHPECHFNLSHSDDLALIAVGRGGPVGVDIEMLRPMRDALSLAEAHFSEAERQAFLAVAPTLRDEAFLRIWTRKEACVKAIGMGLRFPLTQVDVGLGPEAQRLNVAWSEGQSAVLEVTSLHVALGAVAAVAHVVSVGRA